jgi:diguanylate cyclase (GGDEF)-like protein/PAS domain S-box-containing protein
MTTKSGSALSSNESARCDRAPEPASRVEPLRSLLGTSETFLTTVVENIPAVVFAKDAHTGRFILVNRVGEEFLGVPRSAIIGKTDHDIFAKEEADRFVARDQRALQSRQPQVVEEEPVHTPHNGIRCLRTRVIAVRDSLGRAHLLLGISEDITEQKLAGERMRYMAHHDGLTSLANRALFRQRLDAAMTEFRRTGRKITLYFFDLDGFKKINDTLGHPIGDALLRMLADRIRQCAGDGDTVARLGGDEFAIVHPASSMAKDETALARELVQRISKPYDIGGNRLTVTASVGVSSSGEVCADSDRMLRNADVALYRAKEGGRNTFRFYDPSMDHRLEEKRAKELAVRNALARGEFEVHYQPFVSVINERICGLEALLRWRHPEHGLLPPAEFIPVAEEAGFIGTLGEWVLRKACEDAAGWPVYIGLAVNISPSQCNAALPQTVMSALAMSRLSPAQLELEITESALLQDSSTTVSVLHQLRGFGVKISMDDFGTGYSSLSYLRSFPFDKIKIDKSFVQDVLTDADSLAIVRAVAGLGASFGVPTTAEGVETVEQLEEVRRAGCTHVQGYYFGRPMPLDEVLQVLNRRRAAIRKSGYA